MPIASENPGQYEEDAEDDEPRQASSDGRGSAPAALRLRPSGSLVLAAGGGHERVDARLDPARVVVLAKPRNDLVVDDPFRGHVGDGPLEAVPDLDPDFPVLREDEEDGAVVGLLLTRPPLLRGADGEVLESEPLRDASIDPDEDLIRGVALELSELLVQSLGDARAEDVRPIGDVSGRLFRNLFVVAVGARKG